MKRILLALLVLMTGFAADITAVVTPNKATLDYGVGGTFNLSVTNRDTRGIANLKLSVTGIPTWLRAYPTRISIGPESEGLIHLYLSNKALPTTYIYGLELQDADTLQLVWEGNFIVSIEGEGPEGPTTTEPKKLIIQSQESVVPGDTIVVSLEASSNLVPSEAEIILIKDDKEVAKVSETLNKINEDFTLKVPETEVAGIYVLRVNLPGNAISNETFITVDELSKVEITTEIQTKLLGKEVTFVASNLGNVFEEDYITTTINFFDRPLLEVTPTPEITKQGLSYVLSWGYRISPGEEKIIASFKIDYAPYSIIGVLFIIALILVLQKPEAVEVKKELERYTGKEETKFKVKLHVTNSSDEVVDDVVLEDLVPKIAKVTKAFIKKPDAKKKRDGTLLRWELKKLQPGEERIFSYEAVLGFGIIGKMELPKPKVHWKQ